MESWQPVAPVPSPSEVAAGASPRGGFTAATLASWGVPWPPPHGWRARLEAAWHAETGASDPLGSAMRARAIEVVTARPGCSLVFVARAMGVRIDPAWDAIADLLEHGRLRIEHARLWPAA